MTRLLAAFTASLALAIAAPALAQVPAPGQPGSPAVPLNFPPQPGANPTANLLFDAMLAVARAAATNPAAAQSAALSYQHAVQSYNLGDLQRAHSQAIQALIDANRQQPHPIPTLMPQIVQPVPRQTLIPAASLLQIDTDAWVAQARGALTRCPSSELAAAQAHVANAERADRTGSFPQARTEARAAVDLCATPQR